MQFDLMTVVIPSGLRGDIYYLPRNTETLADLTRLHPQGTIYTTSLDVPPQNFLIGFPGTSRRFEWLQSTIRESSGSKLRGFTVSAHAGRRRHTLH